MIKRLSLAIASGRGVAERWRSQYERDKGEWLKIAGGDSKDYYNKLCELGRDPDINKVAEIIGNKGWSYLTCSGCGEYVERAVDYGTNYSDQQLLICEECIRDGTRTLERAKAA